MEQQHPVWSSHVHRAPFFFPENRALFFPSTSNCKVILEFSILKDVTDIAEKRGREIWSRGKWKKNFSPINLEFHPSVHHYVSFSRGWKGKRERYSARCYRARRRRRRRVFSLPPLFLFFSFFSSFYLVQDVCPSDRQVSCLGTMEQRAGEKKKFLFLAPFQKWNDTTT